MIAAGAVVTSNVPPNAIIAGNPARIRGYANTPRFDAPAPASFSHARTGVRPSTVSGVGIYELPLVQDLRGDLSFAECGQFLPFVPKRYFLVFGVPSKEVRGEHAHKTCHQFLVCTHGSCSVVVDDTRKREEIVLDRPNLGVHLPPMVWGIQYKYSTDAVLMVLASDTYSASDYIRSYDEYRSIVGAS
jgi:dTDP-4-dehydrorhamnose 3,5-epimerase-like enzyme